jgi:hypothetical protein
MVKIFSKASQSAIISLFLVSHCWGVLLDNNEIIETHKNMATIIRNAYTTLPYSASEKFNNLCTASIEFIYVEDGETHRKNGEFLFKGNSIITSSSYTENLYTENNNNPSKILSWPFFKTGNLRSIKDLSNFKKSTPTNIYNYLYNVSKNNQTCAESLSLSLDNYNSILTNPQQVKNPLYYLKTNYGYATLEDMKHSEPLLIWKLDRNFSSIKEKFSTVLKKTWEENNENKMSEENSSPEIKKQSYIFTLKNKHVIDANN